MATDVEAAAANQLISDITAYMQKAGGAPAGWYVGIANSTDRLFNGHGINRQSDLWIYRTASTAALAREIEVAFHEWGCKGGPGGGSYDTRIVYAYKITGLTRE